MRKNQHGRPTSALSDGRPETTKGNEDNRGTPVGCRPKFLRYLCQRFGESDQLDDSTSSSLLIVVLVVGEDKVVRLLEGLSDRGEDSSPSGETPSVSSSSKVVRPEDSWIARSYLSIVVDEEGLEKYRSRFQIPEDIVLWIPDSDEVACSSRSSDVAFYEADFRAALPDRRLSGVLDLKCAAKRPEVGGRVRREWGVPSVSLKIVSLKRLNDRSLVRMAITGCFERCTTESITLRGMATAKLNKEKLKKMMSQQDEAPITLGKRRKTDSSSKKVVDETNLPPPQVQKLAIPNPDPATSVEVVEVPIAPSSSRPVEKVPTLPRDASLASRRAKSVVTKDDVGEYDKVNIDVVKVATVHLLMKGLTKLTVIANRCIQWEDALLKQKVQMSEVAQANQRLTTLVNELTLDRDRVVGELSSLKVDMTMKDEELRKVMADNKSAHERVKTLTSQLETIKTSAVEEFKSSEAYDDINTKYFITGFELLRKQAKEKYSDLDFDAFQPYEDEKSIMPVKGGTTSADPQLDDDATT
uniref:Uncharacterized protein n=1 Tax=Fagus sylvatica TaxID=28930 RepID=A0A2N9GG92_FAGSY